MKKKIKSICSYNNLNLRNKKKTFLLKRFNPWGWATWRDRWKEFNPDIKESKLHKEKLEFKDVKLTSRSYK